jgi:murein L,D-transpeptidase YafK
MGEFRKSGAERGPLAGLLAATLLVAVTMGAAAAEVWIHVDTADEVLRVMRGDAEVVRFEGIAVGRGGVKDDRLRGDESTPRGVFRVRWVNEESAYRRFYGFDYPTEDHAARAWLEGRIDRATYDRIAAAARRGAVPPQGTVLGGQLGIHGLGPGDAALHARFHWTRGCIALTNEQLDRLGRWIRLGTRVVVD